MKGRRSAMHRPWLYAAAVGLCALALSALAAPSASANSVLNWGGRIPVEGQPSPPDGTNSVRSISCTTQHLCAAGDNAGNIITTTNPDGGAAAWKLQNVDGSHVISAISCLPTLCVAVDYSGNAIVSSDPTSATPTWAAAAVDSGHSLAGVSCPTPSLCVAVDGDGNVVTSTDPTGGVTKWTAATVDPGQRLNAVSCPSVSFCVAVDNHGDSVSSTNPTGGTPAWTVHTGVDSTNNIDAVSCPSVSLCVATDDSNAENILSSTAPGTDAVWKATSVGTGTFEELFGVSCPSPTLCTVVDDGGRAFTSTKPTGSAADWKRDNNADARWSFYGVSCSPTAPPLCVGVDQGGNVVVAHLRRPDTQITQATSNPAKGTARFSFRADGIVSGFQCELKRAGTTASFSFCPSPKAYSHLKAGSYTFLVRAVNSAGPDQTPATSTFKIGRVPNTKITKAKIDTKTQTATFSFKATGTASGFQCELKKKGAKAHFSHCSSPKSYKNLAAGSYTFLVRAVNSLGADRTPAHKRFKI